MNPDNWFATAAVGGIIVLSMIGLAYRRWRRPAGLERAIKSVSLDALRDIVLPDGLGGDIYIDHLLLTSRGIVVIDIKDFAGTVFASDRMDEWTVMGPNGRFGFPNPQRPLHDRVFAVQRLVRGVPVAGFILFGRDADFAKGQPSHVMTAAELETRYKKPPRAEADNLANAFAHDWRQVCATAEPAALGSN